MNTIYSQEQTGLRLTASGKQQRVSPDASDAELVAASMRDSNAFAALFERHWVALYRFCQHRAGSAGEDIAAETFKVAFDRRRRYSGRYPDARPWLFGIATNLLRDHFRGAQREESTRTRAAALDNRSHQVGELCGLERQLLGPQLSTALQGLPAADRDALLLFAWADLDYEEIARALEVPIGTVRSRIHRARKRVRLHLHTYDTNLTPSGDDDDV